MIRIVKPPPQLPHPAVRALAKPTTFLANISLVQSCVMTNVAPATPMKNRSTQSSARFLGRPLNNVQIPTNVRRPAWTPVCGNQPVNPGRPRKFNFHTNKIRTAPYLSPSGPTTNRATTHAATLQTLLNQIPRVEMSRSWRIITRSGA
jgi:hypothetical protein